MNIYITLGCINNLSITCRIFDHINIITKYVTKMTAFMIML